MAALERGETTDAYRKTYAATASFRLDTKALHNSAGSIAGCLANPPDATFPSCEKGPQTALTNRLLKTYDKKRPRYHSPQTLVEFEFPVRTSYSTLRGTRSKTIY